MVVLYTLKWDVRADISDPYFKWVQSAISRTLAVSGVAELRAYRAVTGSSQVVVTYEFPDLSTWSAWYSSEDVQKVLEELYTVATNVSKELWGPSPMIPEPIRPGK